MTTDRTCDSCGVPVDNDARYCSGCGADVTADQTKLAGPQVRTMSATAQVQQAVLNALRDATLGEYEILTELGRGGMATVYLAHDVQLDRKVAIKVMSPAVLGGEGMVERFKLEARTAAALSHHHIIPIYAVRETQDLVFFVMKFVAGRPLDSIIKQLGPLPIPMVQDILAKVSDALAYAHRRGVVHRDIKPGNIMIDEEGSPVVTDFGIAKVAEKQGLTMTGAAIGTPSYMSPEQCAAKPVTGASDQYSLGIVAYEMLTGKVPFDADSIIGIMYKHFNEAPAPFLDSRSDCPPDLHEAVLRMLAKKPEDRWPSVQDMAASLGGETLSFDSPIRTQMIELAKEGAPVDALKRVSTPKSPIPSVATDATVRMSSGQVTKAKSRETGPPKKSRAVLWGVAAVLTLGAGGAGWFLTQSQPTTAPPAASVATAAPGTTPAVASIAVSPPQVNLAVGESAQLSATSTDGQGNPVPGVAVAWSSDNATVATVSAAGLVLGVGAGSATISVAGGDRLGTATVAVTQPTSAAPSRPAPPRPAPVASVRIVNAPSRLTVGSSARLSAVARNAQGATLSGRSVQWASSNPAVARVSGTGTVTALAPGMARVSATSEGQTTGIDLTIEVEPVASVSVTPVSGPLAVGATVQLSAQAIGGSGQPLAGRVFQWSSTNPGVATVTPGGVVRGVGGGTATITATSEGQSGATSVMVSAPQVAAEPPPVVDDRQAIQDVVAEYAAALESRDIPQIRRIYPGLTQQQEQGLRAAFESMRGLEVTLRMSQLEVNADFARARLTGTYDFYNTSERRDESQNVQFEAEFERRGNAWRISLTR